jgi:hypothetical protein
VFAAPALTVAVVLESYFEPDHLAAQDALANLGERTVVEADDDGAVRKATWSVTSLRPMPLFTRPFIQGGKLRYLETMVLRRAAAEIDLAVVPQILKGRVRIDATYQFTEVAPGQIKRRYAGTITANIPLLSGRVERGILAEMEAGMPLLSDCTQTWLAAHAVPR